MSKEKKTRLIRIRMTDTQYEKMMSMVDAKEMNMTDVLLSGLDMKYQEFVDECISKGLVNLIIRN